MLSDLLLWNKIGRIATELSNKLHITPLEALEMFYTSKTCDLIHNPHTLLYTLSDAYLADEIIIEHTSDTLSK